MSKSAFATLLKSILPEVNKTQIDGYWLLALDANLPVKIFNQISSSFYKVPEIHAAYEKKVGFSPLVVDRDLARRLILETLIEGGRYMSELQRLFTIPANVRQEILEELISDGIVVWEFCPIGNCISYDLSSRLRPSGELKKGIKRAMFNADKMSLYRLSLFNVDFDYVWLCVWARSIFFNGSDLYEVESHNGRVVILNKAGTL